VGRQIGWRTILALAVVYREPRQLKVDYSGWMPVVFRYQGFRFFFYSNEGNPREPVHIHVERAEIEAKFWLLPSVHVSYNDGYSARTLRELLKLVEANSERIVRAWNDHFRD
jgi:hypothetical protein